MRLIKFILCTFPFILLYNFIAGDMKKSTVLVCYGKLRPETIKGYDYVILESKHYLPSNIRVIKSQNEKVFAYISLGEVNAHAPHYDALKNNTLGKNEIWNSYYIDLRSPKTIEILMKIIESTFQKGYDGLFLDNVDNFTIHGPQKNQKAEFLDLLKKMKAKYPKKQFLQNAGLEIAAETAPYIDAIAVESIASNYDFKNKKYRLRDKKQYEEFMAKAQSVSQKHKVHLFLIEYSNSLSLNQKIAERIKDSGFDYFIGNIDLQTLPKFKE